MESILRRLNWLYNPALENRKTACGKRKQPLSFYDQCKWLTQLRAANEHGRGEIAVGAGRGMLKRVELAFQAFLRRVRAGEAPGFPRFRPLSRCRTVDVAGPCNAIVRSHNGYYLICAKAFPRLRVCSARPLPMDAPPKSLRLTQRGRNWEASLVYEVEREALAPWEAAVGIDMGIRKHMACSDGTVVLQARRNWKRKRRLQRAVSRCMKGSATRRKRVAALQRFESKQGLITVEKLQIGNMTRSGKGTAEEPGSKVKSKAGLNREVLTQNWSLLRSQLRYKAEWAGRRPTAAGPADWSRIGVSTPR